jgi:hypothetical protein
MKAWILAVLTVLALLSVYALGETGQGPEWATAQQAQELRVDLAQLKLRVGKLEREMVQLRADVAVQAKAEPQEEVVAVPQDKPLSLADLPPVPILLGWTDAQREMWEANTVGRRFAGQVVVVSAVSGRYGFTGRTETFNFAIKAESRVGNTWFLVSMYTNDPKLAAVPVGQRLSVLGYVMIVGGSTEGGVKPQPLGTRTYYPRTLGIDVTEFQFR